MTAPLNGNEAIEAATERAKLTGDRNVPDFGDLPIPADTANVRQGPPLHDACLQLVPLIGVWRGTGEVDYPTMDGGPITYGQQVIFSHDGRPFLMYESRTWLLDDRGQVIRPAARETGFWRPKGEDGVEVLLTHSSGVVEIYYGTALTLTSWELSTDIVMRTETAKEVNAAKRLYGIVPDGGLAYVEERAMVGQPLTPHTAVHLHRFAG